MARVSNVQIKTKIEFDRRWFLGETFHPRDHMYFSVSAFLNSFVYVGLNGQAWIEGDDKLRIQFDENRITPDDYTYQWRVQFQDSNVLQPGP